MEVKEITNTSIWKSLYADSNNLEEPVIYKNFFTEPLLSEDEVRQILINWSKIPFYHAVLDIDMGVKGEKRDRYDQLLYKQPFQSDKSLEELYYEVFGDKKASILLKSPEQYSEPLAKRAAKFVEPLLEEFGLPQLAWTTALIIGNYNYTPFGVHFDAGNQRAIHTMIGKGKKKMWFWTRELVDEVLSSHGLNTLRYYSESELPKLLPYGECHVIEEDDFYFLPNHHYHIAHTEEFTIGLAVVLDRVDQNNLVQTAVQNFVSYNLTEHLQHSSESFEPEPVDYKNLTIAEQKFQDKNWLSNIVQNAILKIESNLGMAGIPQLKPATQENLEGVKVKINAPFKIKWLADKNGLTIYVRYRVIPLAFDNSEGEHEFSLIPILERLNKGDEVNFSSIVEQLKEEMDMEDIVYLMKLIYSYGGVLFD